MRSTFLCASILLTATVVPLRAADLAQLSPSQWRHDLRVLEEGVPRLHPNPFHTISQAAWKAEIADLSALLPRLTTNQILVRLLAVVASLGEGHTSLNPFYRPELKVHYLPIRVEVFSDGLYIRSAPRELASVVGAKIVSVGDVPAAKALEMVSTVVSHDNASGARNAAPMFLAVPEILNGLGIASDPLSIPFGLEREGRSFTVTLHPAGILESHGHAGIGAMSEGWLDARPTAVPPPLYQQKPAKLYWSEYLPDSKTFYIQYRAVQDDREDPIATFFPRAIADAERSPADRLVIDVRGNGGGKGNLNRPIIRSLIRCRFDVRGHLFVIIGRGTFSAGQGFVNDVAYWTNALLVGEPTANNPSLYGDAVELALPESGLVVLVSTLFHQSTGRPADQRTATLPDVPAATSFALYRQGLDPALAAVLTYRSITDGLSSALERGDGAEVTRLYRAFKSAPETASIPTEAEVNALGYRLLADKRGALAILVLQLNADSYPNSANAYDSLGEAFLGAGDRDHGIANYQRALALDPHSESARRILRELGAASPAPTTPPQKPDGRSEKEKKP